MCSMNAVLVGLLFEGAARAVPLGRGRLLGKQRPRDTRVLGRDRDAGTVISATLAYRKGPSGQWIGQACSPLQYGASPHDEESSQVRVTALGDVPEPCPAAG